MPEESPAHGRLDSWKEIAAYLNRDVRTVIRWEREKALPVHRVPGGRRKAVFAYKHEIDAWLAGGNASGDHAAPPAAEDAGTAEPQDNSPQVFVTAAVSEAESDQAPQGIFHNRNWKLMGLVAGLVVLAGVTVALLPHSHTSAAVRPFSLNKITDDGKQKAGLVFAGLRTDGTRLFFTEMQGGRQILVSAPLSGSPVRPIETPFSNVYLQDLSRDGTTLLITSFEGFGAEGPLWALPVNGGTPQRVGSARCYYARWSPDNSKIACAGKTSISVMDPDGSNARTIASFSSPVGLITWTPDGAHLRYTLEDATVHTFSTWEIAVTPDRTSTQPHRLPLGPDCCVDWTWMHDGKAFAYAELDANGKTHLMIQTRDATNPTELPLDIGTLRGVVASKSGDGLYLVIDTSIRSQLLRFEAKLRVFETMLPGLSAEYLSYSPDGKWMAYTKSMGDGPLWRSRADGSEPLLLVKPPMEVEVSSWSPDGKRIAFMGRRPDQPWRIYIVGRDGGAIEEASEGNDNQGGPSWSHDGKAIVYGNVLCDKLQDCWIRRVDLATRKEEILPGSNGMRTGRWSPDGKYIAALRFQTHELALFDLRTGQWKTLAGSVTGDNVNWSGDSQYVYVDGPRNKKPLIERIHVSDGRRTTVVSLASLQKVNGQISPWVGLAPDNSLIVSQFLNASEIYKLDFTNH